MSLKRFVGGMAVYLMPARYGSSWSSRLRYALPPVIHKKLFVLMKHHSLLPF